MSANTPSEATSELHPIRLTNVLVLLAVWAIATVLGYDDFATSMLMGGVIVVANFEFSRVMVARAVGACVTPDADPQMSKSEQGEQTHEADLLPPQLVAPETGSYPDSAARVPTGELETRTAVSVAVELPSVSSSRRGTHGGYVAKIVLKSMFLLGLLTLLVLYGRVDVPGLLVGLSIPWLSIALMSVWRISSPRRAGSFHRLEKN